VSYRHPAVLAKMAASLDQISSGRFILGMGAGWHQQNTRPTGFLSIGARLKGSTRRDHRPQDVDGGGRSFFGEQFHIEDAYCRPSAADAESTDSRRRHRRARAAAHRRRARHDLEQPGLGASQPGAQDGRAARPLRQT
jgi:hypothetical protein